MSLKLLIDDRERAIIPYFSNEYQDIGIEVKRLFIGDYAIVYENQVIVTIERKTWDDLAASIKDTRIENIEKLKTLRKATDCKIIYLIEGKPRHKDTRKFARIPYKNLLAHLDHIMIRDNVHIVYSDNEEDSAKRLIDLCKNCLTLDLHYIVYGSGEKMDIDTVFIDLTENEIGESSCGATSAQYIHDINEDGALNGLTMLTTSIPKTDLQIIYNIWCCVPYVTTKTASLFIDAGFHISDLICGRITKAQISTMRYKNGTIIGNRADKIIQLAKDDASNYKHYVNILAEIPRITKKTAILILVNMTFKELIMGEIPETEIANIEKTEKTKIGKAAAANIYKFLVDARAE